MAERIYTLDLVKRLGEIESEIEDAQENNDTEWEKELRAEAEQIEDIEGYCPDFRYGETLIPESEFQYYAQELADEIGAIDADAGWPLSCIDWKQAAEELSSDYTLVEYQGVSYYVR